MVNQVNYRWYDENNKNYWMDASPYYDGESYDYPKMEQDIADGKVELLTMEQVVEMYHNAVNSVSCVDDGGLPEIGF